MKNLHFFILILGLTFLFPNISHAETIEKQKTFKVTEKGNFDKATVSNTKTAITPNPDGTIMISVKNEFDKEIKVKFDTNREYPIRANEWISLGDRKPGKYTLTVYTKDGDFVDNLSLDVTKRNKFTLNEDTVSSSNKITGLSTGKKVAITAGAIGATAIGAAILGKALMSAESIQQAPYVSHGQVQQQAVQPTPTVDPSNAFASSGKPVKVLNTAYDNVTFIVEGVNGNPIGNNWIIPKKTIFTKPQALVYNGQNILIGSKQKVKVLLPDGNELIRGAFELEKDSFDGAYIWIVK